MGQKLVKSTDAKQSRRAISRQPSSWRWCQQRIANTRVTTFCVARTSFVLRVRFFAQGGPNENFWILSHVVCTKIFFLLYASLMICYLFFLWFSGRQSFYATPRIHTTKTMVRNCTAAAKASSDRGCSVSDTSCHCERARAKKRLLICENQHLKKKVDVNERATAHLIFAHIHRWPPAAAGQTDKAAHWRVSE